MMYTPSRIYYDCVCMCVTTYICTCTLLPGFSMVTVYRFLCHPFISAFLWAGEKMDADRMDEKRKEHVAYEYLCHLEEAKQ